MREVGPPVTLSWRALCFLTMAEFNSQRPAKFPYADDDLSDIVDELCMGLPPEPESEWWKQAKAVLIPTPGYTKSYTEIEAELIAGGVSVPPGLRRLAADERSTLDCPATAGLRWRPPLND